MLAPLAGRAADLRLLPVDRGGGQAESDAADALGIAVDPEIRNAREQIEANKLLIIDDHDGYRAWLDGLLAEVAAEATRRNLDSPAA